MYVYIYIYVHIYVYIYIYMVGTSNQSVPDMAVENFIAGSNGSRGWKVSIAISGTSIGNIPIEWPF